MEEQARRSDRKRRASHLTPQRRKFSGSRFPVPTENGNREQGNGELACGGDFIAASWQEGVRRSVVFAGLLLSLLFWARSHPAGDQLNLLARGWLFAAKEQWIHYGNPTSSGGAAPGGLTSLLVGAPLVVWQHHRATVIPILLTHCAAYFLLDRLLRTLLTRRERLMFALLYWLNPWRIYFSGFLWNPNYLFLFGALHLRTAYQQRNRASGAASALHTLSIGLAFQLHNSAVLLGIATLVLLLRKRMRFHWPAAIAGALASALMLIPWLRAVIRNPELLPVSDGFLGRGLLHVHPMLRGVLYWIRYPSLYVSEKWTRLDFATAAGTRFDRLAAQPLEVFLTIAGVLTALAAIAANIWFFRKTQMDQPGAAEGREWLWSYVRNCFLAALITFALAPTTVMSWQVLLLFHASVLPVAFWCAEKLGGMPSERERKIVWGYASVSILVSLVLAFGSPQFRCGGRDDVRFPLREDYEMLRDLQIQQECPWPVDRRNGWSPDVL